jgi:hypothetical protein
MSIVMVATAFSGPEHRAEVIAACESPGFITNRVELYALHEGPDRLVMIEKYESE